MLTTVAQPKYKIGNLAVNLLLRAMEGKSGIKHRVVVNPELVIRNTCKSIL
jgi:DNA-binding LacI/PurR family transcriptional regulator